MESSKEVAKSLAYSRTMKKVLAGFVSFSVFLSLIVLGTPASASVVKNGELILTLPDSIAISGSEVGSGNNPRECSLKASLDSQPGTVIPLRAGVVVGLTDSTGYVVDSGYATANVEGLTHLDIEMVFRCGKGSGAVTLKGPYKFTTSWTGVPGWPFSPDTPVSVTFGASASTPSPAPSPTTSKAGAPAPAPAPTVTVTASPSVDTLQLLAEVQSLKSQLSNLKNKVKKICSVKPKPKGC